MGVATVVHTDSTSGDPHPVGQCGADVTIISATISAAVTAVNTPAVFIESSENIGPLGRYLTGNFEVTCWCAFPCFTGAVWQFHSNLLTDEHLGSLIGKINANFSITAVGRFDEAFITINLTGLLIV
jgi:hypothetical protein|tara:strand:+ start:5709 stop:6089 length:381 start_codon:yes stop_codon:yes gene_type:complete